MSKAPEHESGANSSSRTETTRTGRWRFDTTELPAIRRWAQQGAEYGSERVKSLTFHDSYVDTKTWDLRRAGFTLRLRRLDDTIVVSMRALQPRVERSPQPWEARASLNVEQLDRLSRIGGKIGRRVRSLIGSKELMTHFDLHTSHTLFRLNHDFGAAHLWLLEAVAEGSGIVSGLRFSRVVVEAVGRDERAARSVVALMERDFDIFPVGTTLDEAALIVLGVSPSPHRYVGSTETSRDQTAGEFAMATLRRLFSRMLLHEPGTRLGEDPEELHDMRVSVRRMRAAIKLYRDALHSRFQWLRQELGWLGRELGAVRDLDVQLESASCWDRDSGDHELDTLHALLEERHRAARREMLSQLDSSRYERLVSSMRDALRGSVDHRGPLAGTAITELAPTLIKKRLKKVRKKSRKIDKRSSATQYHAVRIFCKELRYALEFHVPVYGKAAHTMIKRMTSIQDVLGDHQDADVAVAHLFQIVEEDDGQLTPQAVFAIGRIAERYARQAKGLRIKFRKLELPELLRCAALERAMRE